MIIINGRKRRQLSSLRHESTILKMCNFQEIIKRLSRDKYIDKNSRVRAQHIDTDIPTHIHTDTHTHTHTFESHAHRFAL